MYIAHAIKLYIPFVPFWQRSLLYHHSYKGKILHLSVHPTRCSGTSSRPPRAPVRPPRAPARPAGAHAPAIKRDVKPADLIPFWWAGLIKRREDGWVTSRMAGWTELISRQRDVKSHLKKVQRIEIGEKRE